MKKARQAKNKMKKAPKASKEKKSNALDEFKFDGSGSSSEDD